MIDLALEDTEPITEEDHKHLDWFKKNKAIKKLEALETEEKGG